MTTYNNYIVNILEKSPSYFDKYKSIYFINSSCIGPFIPPICKMNWIDMFNSYLDEYDMIGPIIEFPPDSLGYIALNMKCNDNIPFIHTYMFGINSSNFDLIFDVLNCNKTGSKKDAVYIIERKITSIILVNGGKVKTLLARYKDIDVNNKSNWNTKLYNIVGKPTCYEVPYNYFGIDVNPFEIIFVKNIRNINETRPRQNECGISNELNNMISLYKKWL